MKNEKLCLWKEKTSRDKFVNKGKAVSCNENLRREEVLALNAGALYKKEWEEKNDR